MTVTGSKKCACGKTISANALRCRTCNENAPPRPTGGCLEILNCQHGDLKLTFDKGDISETIRAKRIVTDMLRRGYALVVEVERDGVKAYERIQAFDEARGEYLIADFDSVVAEKEDAAEEPKVIHGHDGGVAAGLGDLPVRPLEPLPKRRGRPPKRLSMESTKATGIGRSAGG